MQTPGFIDKSAQYTYICAENSRFPAFLALKGAPNPSSDTCVKRLIVAEKCEKVAV